MKNSIILREKLNIDPSEIINGIPEEERSNPETVYLDPDMGGGQVISALIEDQKSRGFSEENIRSRIFGFSSDILGLNYAINKRSLIGNFSACDFLSLKIETNMLEFTINNKQYFMNFDIVLGNPPYVGETKVSNVNLWHRFIKSSRAILKPGGFLSFVNPSSFYSSTGEGYKLFMEGVTNRNLLVYKNLGRAFPEANIEVCYFLEQNSPYSGSTRFNGATHDFREWFIYTKEEEIKNSIIKKVIENDLPRLKLEKVWRDKEFINTEGRGTEIHFSGDKIVWIEDNLVPEGRRYGDLDGNLLKLVFPFSSTYRKQFITTTPVCTLNLYTRIANEQEGRQIMSYTLSNLFVKIASFYKKTAGFTPLVKNIQIPNLERKMWTSQDLYKFFDLTQEEIDFVES